MKKVLFSLVSVLFLIPSARSQSQSLNQIPVPGERRNSSLAQPLECSIKDVTLTPVTEVRESVPGSAFNSYWLSFTNNTGQTPSQVVFQVAFNPNSPLLVQTQVFVPGDDTGITTPFGVPFWAMGRIRGAATLTVFAEGLGECSYDFQVIPN